MLALTCAGLFAVRGNVVRWAARDAHPPALVAATTSLAAAALLLLLYLVATRRGADVAAGVRAALLPFVAAGVCLGLAYDSLFEAFDRGRVTIVAPLNGTQSLWAVVIAAVFLRRHELIGRRLVLAALLIVAGGAIIGASR